MSGREQKMEGEPGGIVIVDASRYLEDVHHSRPVYFLLFKCTSARSVCVFLDGNQKWRADARYLALG